ncbi:hypothetical protein ABT56_19100 [Photobacterium aquae]|uniref:Uncharacterized protein n=2 Tax=Photobacterium aquae TaxID=1195763 RepID=A0A0J1JMZ3_9GAMM|nr:hypothetical protein ABT56_19100 [Photobacterium aquae]
MFAMNSDFKTVLNEVGKYLRVGKYKNIDNYTPPVQPTINFVAPQPRVNRVDLLKNKRKLISVFNQTFSIADPRSDLLVKYLRKRGIALTQLELIELGKNIRFHPNMAYQHEGVIFGYFPCMIAVVKKNGKGVSLHRTYLDHDGNKLDVSKWPYKKEPHNAKKIMYTCIDEKIGGSTIKLFNNGGTTLNIAEGIETALSVYRATGENIESGISSTWLLSFNPQPHIRVLNYWADNDINGVGINNAMKLAERLMEIRKDLYVQIFVPTANNRDRDWNDVLRETGTLEFNKLIIHPII